MELIRWAIELGESVHGNTYEELSATTRLLL